MKRVTILMLIVGFVFAGISPVLAQRKDEGAKLDKDKGAKLDRDKGRPEIRRERMRTPRRLDPNRAEARERRGRGRASMMEVEKQLIGELEKIRKLAIKENAKETAEAVEKLLAKRRKQFKQRTEMMERARERFRERSSRPETQRGIRGEYRQRDPNSLKLKPKERERKTKDDKTKDDK
jgi:hypothetical protein